MQQQLVPEGARIYDHVASASDYIKFRLPFILDTPIRANPAPSRPAAPRTRASAREANAASTSCDVMFPSAAPELTKEEKKRRRECKVEGCRNYIVNKGLCCRHGGGKKCSRPGCTTSVKHHGLCCRHGGTVRCKHSECTRKAKARGLCWTHGGGTKCGIAECAKVAVSKGFCWAHGGGKRCVFGNCNKPAYGRTHNFCAKHYEELRNADYYEV